MDNETPRGRANAIMSDEVRRPRSFSACAFEAKLNQARTGPRGSTAAFMVANQDAEDQEAARIAADKARGPPPPPAREAAQPKWPENRALWRGYLDRDNGHATGKYLYKNRQTDK